jgi:23S rRNA (guanosine2251-2'-O)-methyltransferase
VVLDNVRSALNVGSVFRTCDAFGIEKLWLTGITACPPDREIQKTALGATLSVPWEYRKDTMEIVRELRDGGAEIIIVEQTTASVLLQDYSFSSQKKTVLVFGHEVNGVSEEILGLSHGAIEIPQSGAKHSLNIAVCAGITLWEAYRKLR